MAPSRPAPWQKRAPCSGKEVPISGACYRRAHPEDYRPPCEPPTVEHEGTCYYPVVRVPRQPNSVSE